MGHVDLVGPKGSAGQYIDLPNRSDVARVFQEALGHLWGFNNFEALRGFKTATMLAPDCALCFWGVALCFGPNINYDIENQTALNSAAAHAALLAHKQPWLTDKSKKLIAGIQALVNGDKHAYASAMCGSFGPEDVSDPDVASICASAAMTTTAWDYYEGTPDGSHFPLRKRMVPVKQLLLNNINGGDGGSPHAFATHLLIHLLEPTNAPEGYRWQAVAAAQELYLTHGEALLPAQGHLTHMPSHLFLRVGRYASGVATAVRSIANNQRYLAHCLNPYAYGHNLKMLTTHARLAGMSELAIEGARNATRADAGGVDLTPNGATTCVDCAGIGSPEVVLTLARFARWADVLTEPVPVSWGDPRWNGYNEASFRFARFGNVRNI
jgi:hypothetical protein